MALPRSPSSSSRALPYEIGTTGMCATPSISFGESRRAPFVLAAQLPQLAVRQVRGRAVVEVPEVQQGEEIAGLVAELRVRLVGGVVLIQRPLAGVLYG